MYALLTTLEASQATILAELKAINTRLTSTEQTLADLVVRIAQTEDQCKLLPDMRSDVDVLLRSSAQTSDSIAGIEEREGWVCIVRDPVTRLRKSLAFRATVVATPGRLLRQEESYRQRLMEEMMLKHLISLMEGTMKDLELGLVVQRSRLKANKFTLGIKWQEMFLRLQ
ncbi:hypothetical protein MRX96_051339 [Rhipicephalus microplus]